MAKKRKTGSAAGKEVARLLKLHGRLIRCKKHLVYKLRNGKTFVVARTASDHRAEKNQLRDLRKLLAEG